MCAKLSQAPHPLWNLSRKSGWKNGLNLGEDLFFWIEGALAPGRTCTPKTGYFQDKAKISEAKSLIGVLFNAKHIAEGNVPCFPWPGPSHLQNFTLKYKILNVLWTWSELKWGIFQVAFKSQNFFSFKRSENVQNVIQMALKEQFFTKNYEKSPSDWGLRFQPPSVIRLNCTSLLTTSPNFDIFVKLFNLTF